MLARMVRVAALGSVGVAMSAAGIQRYVAHLPTRGVEGLEAAEGLEATLFAEAPMLTNPTNLDVDSRGRVWVTEGFNYRVTLNPQAPVREEGDRIVILEDQDGDGRADTQKVFYQGRDVDAAMGIAVLGNRVIVSAYGNVFVLTDTDGDDRADKKEVLFTLNPANHDHTVHAFVFGPDGRLYFNVGDQGKFVKDAAGNHVVDLAGNPVTSEGTPYRDGMVFRSEMDGSRFEVLGHNFRNPYEPALDSYGTLWQTDNDDDGNRAVRVNYVMEYGNYGYKDELTGAGWNTRRTGMEEEIPQRHWHLNDPGVVPNVLITGSGSPAGLAFYEGDLLPEAFRGAMIHADAGPSVVRAYPVRSDGAGYAGRILNVLKGVDDPWFRPVDVAVAPDGSLLVADWYDPGVGGHRAGELTRGRIIRVAPPKAGYRSPAVDLTTPQGALRALRSPNQATRYLAYTQLKKWGARAEAPLRSLWTSRIPHERARALWLLAGIDGKGSAYIDQAVRDSDPNIRIAGLRAARRVEAPVLPLARRLVRDPSPAVRREVALALRHDPSPEAAKLWAELALQHDGRDRWYLEALGIGADRQWDRFFAAWRQRVGEGWTSPAGRDIVWRARTSAALPLLAQLIRSPQPSEAERLRYFRAFDFHPVADRQPVLLGLLDGTHPEQARIAGLALAHLDPAQVSDPASLDAAVQRTLEGVRGTMQFVELVSKYDVQSRAADLVDLALAHPEASHGVEAARLALRWKSAPRFEAAIKGADLEAARRATLVLGRVGGGEGHRLIEEVVLSADRPTSLRLSAVQALGLTLGGEGRLLRLVEQGKLPEELKPAASAVLFGAYRNTIREAAAKYLQPPAATTADGKTLPSAGILALREGDAQRGKAAYARVCASCHVAQDSGRDFGPGLTKIGEKLSREALYTAILEPDAGIAFNYEGYVVKLRDGSEVVGAIGSETAQELALRMPGGITQRFAKADVVSRTQLSQSLMPDGLERALTEQELLDLVEYLASLR